MEELKLKTCSKCQNSLPETEDFFQRNQSTNTGGDKYFRPECKECTSKERKNANQAKKMAGNPVPPTLGYPCDCCKRTDKPLLFDHDHTTLEHRGWLCENCNQAIGRLGDTIEGLEKALNYLKGAKRKNK